MDPERAEVAVVDSQRLDELVGVGQGVDVGDRLTATDQAALGWVLSKLLARAKPDCAGSREE